MRIVIKPFENIEKFDFKKATKESPLKDFSFPKGLVQKNDNSFFNLLNNVDISHWELVLSNKLRSVERNFGYAMFYYYNGIPDDEWYISPGKQGQSVEYFPHFEEKHHSNFYNFTYFVDVFFLKSATLFETIGHLLYKSFDLEIKEGNRRDKISFHSAIYKLEKINKPLYKELKKITKSNKYEYGLNMRHDIAHNHPPHHIGSGVSESKGLSFYGVGKYTTSTKIKQTMIGLLESIKETFEVLEKHVQLDK